MSTRGASALPLFAIAASMIVLTVADQVFPGLIPFFIPVVILPVGAVALLWRGSDASWRAIASWAIPAAIVLVGAHYLGHPWAGIVVGLTYAFLLALMFSQAFIRWWLKLTRPGE